MDLIDRQLLNLIQGPFPLVYRPYLNLAEQLQIGEQEVIDRLGRLKQSNVLRQVSAIFDTRRLGYKTTLAALAYDPKKLHHGAIKINQHPGVSHNYAARGLTTTYGSPLRCRPTTIWRPRYTRWPGKPGL